LFLIFVLFISIIFLLVILRWSASILKKITAAAFSSFFSFSFFSFFYPSKSTDECKIIIPLGSQNCHRKRKKEMTKEERMSIRNEQIAKRERGNERHRKDVQNKNQFFCVLCKSSLNARSLLCHFVKYCQS